MESEGYLISRKFYFCIQEVLQQQRLFWHRVHANYKQITKADSAEGNARVSTKLIQVRVTILTIFCLQHEIFPPVVHWWTTGGHRKSCGCHLCGPPVGLRWIIGDHRWTVIGLRGKANGAKLIDFIYTTYTIVH